MSTTITHVPLLLDGAYKTAVMSLSTASALNAGTVLGKETKGPVEITVAAKGGGNTGTGGIEDAAVKRGYQLGTYKITCTAVVGDVATFKVEDPEENELGKFTVETGESYTWNNEIVFKITNNAAAAADPPAPEKKAFIATDAFTFKTELPNDGASGLLKILNLGSTDGTENAYAILAQDVKGSAQAQLASVYLAGTFNANEVVLPESVFIQDVFDELRKNNIYLEYPADVVED